jgi:hypothetical protein
MKIETKRKRIESKILKLRGDLAALQTECSTQGHGGKLEGKYKSNTGNWSPSDDYYWVEFKCPLCDKRWSEDQDHVWYDRADKVMRSKESILFTKVER